MAGAALRIVGVLAALLFSLLAFIFSILATTSHKWALRDYYETVVQEQWIHPNYTISRSPFRICTATPNYAQSVSSDGEPVLVLSNYTVACEGFSVHGTSKTSCELRSITKTDNATNVGDARLCQQIHDAGNYAISSTLFVSLGFLLTLGLSALTIHKNVLRSSQTPATANLAHSSSDQDKQRGHETAASEPERHGTQPQYLRTSIVNFVAVSFLCIGAILAILSQFNGVLGFIQSAPNNADWASSAAGNAKADGGYHGPWYEGVALRAYMTCAWTFALAAAVTASRAWRLPTWH